MTLGNMDLTTQRAWDTATAEAESLGQTALQLFNVLELIAGHHVGISLEPQILEVHYKAMAEAWAHFDEACKVILGGSDS